ncbi:MAG: nucleotide-binding protein [Nitrospirae bacterium YQR-1]
MKIFVSHGHNDTVKLKLKDFIANKLSLTPVILAEQPDDGLTIIEKLEKYGRDCDFALVLLTSDDGEDRARQNVIHELGFFHGLIGRNKVLLLK